MLSLQEYREHITVRPKDFAYFGDLDLEVWGTMLTTSRDADTIDRSNWEVISEDMQERFPDAVEIEHFTHWAVGWVEELKVDTNNEEALRAAYKWYEKLLDYPVASDEHHSKLEWEEIEEGWEGWAEHDILRELEDQEVYALLDLDEDGYVDGWRDEGSKYYVKVCYTDACFESGNDPGIGRIIEKIAAGYDHFLQTRKEGQRAEYEKYQPTIEEASK